MPVSSKSPRLDVAAGGAGLVTDAGQSRLEIRGV